MTLRPFRKPVALLLASMIAALLLVVGCGEAATTAPPTEEAAAPIAAPTTAPQQGAQPTAAPVATTAPAMVEPAGEFTLAWHAGLSSSWLDPQDNPAMATPYNFAYALHDALVKTMPAGLNTGSLAEEWEWADDFSSITFSMRPGTKQRGSHYGRGREVHLRELQRRPG